MLTKLVTYWDPVTNGSTSGKQTPPGWTENPGGPPPGEVPSVGMLQTTSHDTEADGRQQLLCCRMDDITKDDGKLVVDSNDVSDQCMEASMTTSWVDLPSAVYPVLAKALGKEGALEAARACQQWKQQISPPVDSVTLNIKPGTGKRDWSGLARRFDQVKSLTQHFPYRTLQRSEVQSCLTQAVQVAGEYARLEKLTIDASNSNLRECPKNLAVDGSLWLPLTRMPYIKELQLVCIPMLEDSLHALAKISTLRTLRMYSCSLTDSKLKGIECLTQLTELEVFGGRPEPGLSTYTDMFRHVLTLKGLQKLVLTSTYYYWVTSSEMCDSSVVAKHTFKELPGLKTLVFGHQYDPSSLEYYTYCEYERGPEGEVCLSVASVAVSSDQSIIAALEPYKQADISLARLRSIDANVEWPRQPLDHQVLDTATSVTRLSIYNKVSDQMAIPEWRFAHQLVTEIAHFPNVKELNVGGDDWCNWPSEWTNISLHFGPKFMLEVIQRFAELSSLDLQGMSATLEVGKLFEVQKLRSLKKLYLRGTGNDYAKSHQTVDVSWFPPTLTTVVVQGFTLECSCPDTMLAHLEEVYVHKCDVKDLAVVRAFSQTEYLDWYKCRTDLSFQQIFGHMKRLRQLEYQVRCFDVEVLDSLGYGLPQDYDGLKQLRSLRKVVVDLPSFANPAVFIDNVVALTTLRTLNFKTSDVSMLDHLSKLTALQFLRVLEVEVRVTSGQLVRREPDRKQALEFISTHLPCAHVRINMACPSADGAAAAPPVADAVIQDADDANDVNLIDQDLLHGDTDEEHQEGQDPDVQGPGVQVEDNDVLVMLDPEIAHQEVVVAQSALHPQDLVPAFMGGYHHQCESIDDVCRLESYEEEEGDDLHVGQGQKSRWPFYVKLALAAVAMSLCRRILAPNVGH